MTTKPTLLIPRKLADAVLDRARDSYNVILNADDHVLTRDELIAACQNVDAVLPCHSEHFSADVIAALPDQLRIIANHSVGVDHVDLPAAKARGIVIQAYSPLGNYATHSLLTANITNEIGRAHNKSAAQVGLR